ncbi:MAG: sugar phosphate isomerase/epimerase [Microscillaceae bacterium]|nr:sugar phosphate isomerase/epimerase [Microscillaceae bacterium]
MKLGIFAKTFPIKPVEALFAEIQKHQIAQVHYNMACSGLSELPLEVPEPITEEVKAAAQKHQIEIVGISATFNMIHPDPQIRKEGLKSLESLAAACVMLGTDSLSLCTGSRDTQDKWKWHPDNAQPEAWQDLIATMEKALLIAEKYHVILGVEPEAGNVVRNAQIARRLLNEMQSKHIKIILDPANLFEKATHKDEINQLIAEAFELLHEDIAVAHAKDRTLDGQFRAAGKGDIDFGFFIKQLEQINFQGTLQMHGLEAGEVSSSLEYLKEMIDS